jgi:hypothetical protein
MSELGVRKLRAERGRVLHSLRRYLNSKLTSDEAAYRFASLLLRISNVQVRSFIAFISFL